MSTKRKGLGKGLDALLSAGLGVSAPPTPDQVGGSAGQNIQAEGRLAHIPVECCQRGKYQPRRDMHPEQVEELAESTKAQGVMQPIVVRQIGPDKYEII